MCCRMEYPSIRGAVMLESLSVEVTSVSVKERVKSSSVIEET